MDVVLPAPDGPPPPVSETEEAGPPFAPAQETIADKPHRNAVDSLLADSHDLCDLGLRERGG